MDSEARQLNLQRFRHGECPLMLVTDVAARGLDVPLINNVINFGFPAAPKLFVHRVGRAARQGRAGVAISLVSPDELPYMIELHLFLGRRLADAAGELPLDAADKNSKQLEQRAGADDAARDDDDDAANDDDDTDDDDDAELVTYRVNEMTPDAVHYGSVPQGVLDAEHERLSALSVTCQEDAEALRALTKVCSNAMMQYKRTRPEPSKAAVRRARTLRLRLAHPLFVEKERRAFTNNAAHFANNSDAASRAASNLTATHHLLDLDAIELPTESADRDRTGAGGLLAPAAASAGVVRGGAAAARRAGAMMESIGHYRPPQTILEVRRATARARPGRIVASSHTQLASYHKREDLGKTKERPPAE